MTTNKTPKTEEKKPKEKASKAKPERRKSKAAAAAAAASDEEMVDAEPEPEEKSLDPAEARKAREKEGKQELKFLRQSLIIVQFCFSDTNFRKASCLETKRLKRKKCHKCRRTSRNLKVTLISRCLLFVRPRSTRS